MQYKLNQYTMKEYAFYLILSLLFVSVQAQEVSFTEYDMDNGLHVILHQDNTCCLKEQKTSVVANGSVSFHQMVGRIMHTPTTTTHTITRYSRRIT